MAGISGVLAGGRLARLRWSGILAAGILISVGPLFLGDYAVAQLSFACIYAIAGLGMLVLTGLSGQVSLGHGAFLAVGAYTSALLQGSGVPFGMSLLMAGITSGTVGFVVAFLFSRLSGPYFAMATLAFASVIQEMIARWETLTNGTLGIRLLEVQSVASGISSEHQLFYAAAVLAVCAFAVATGIWNSSVGRAFAAVRDDESAAKASGIDPERHRALAFLLSAIFAGLAGGLYAQKTLYISPEAFGFGASLELLVLAVVGGLGSPLGAVMGALFVIGIPEAITMVGTYMPDLLVQRAAVQGLAYGVALFVVMVLEPRGLYGLWLGLQRLTLTAVAAVRLSVSSR